MHILFANNTQVPVELTNSPVQDIVLGAYKNLQHVPIEFYDWDSPFYLDTIPFDAIVDRVVQYGKAVGFEVERERCTDQQYLNLIHQYYEFNYDGSDNWLAFHESLHLCEEYNYRYPGKCAVINYREKSGPLEKKFEFNWISAGTTKIRAGDVFLAWAELGKTPYEYWRTGETNDIARICEFAKPWTKLRLKLNIATQDADTLANKRVDEFDTWWAQYKTEWCQHWNIPDWTVTNMYSPIVIGRVEQLDQFLNLLEQRIYPKQVRL